MSCYERFGVTEIINASGSVTRLGGAPMPATVLDAFREAAGATVPLEILQAAAAEKIASACGTESGLVTAGSAAALTLGAAAILAGTDAGRMEQLPHCDGFPNEFLVAREHRNGYDHAVRAAGARFVEVGMNEIVSGAGVRRTEAWEYEAAITPQTAGILYVKTPDSRPSLPEVMEVARKHNLPVLVDAAGELPPRENLKAIPATGADLVCFSGGKAVRGPQSTGILCGRRDLVMSAAVQMLDMDDHPELWEPPESLIDRSRLSGMPRHGIGRTLKVSKEEIIALLTALDLFCSGAYDSDRERFHGWLTAIADRLEGTCATCRIDLPDNGQTPPTLTIHLAGAACPREAAWEVCRQLRKASPPVYVSHGRLDQGELVVYPLCLTEAAVPVLADRLHEKISALK
ncbi:MAG: aminotransferase class V-fold PLP-dependent enzyme [Planctomycetaceae bacterium]|nr:aminotransferase class V-fold PLP-dependent enzyme [Planctomycetaceae bacterium]